MFYEITLAGSYSEFFRVNIPDLNKLEFFYFINFNFIGEVDR